jgi:hypothetical protein
MRPEVRGRKLDARAKDQPECSVSHLHQLHTVDKQEGLMADQLHQGPPPVNGPFAVTIDGRVAEQGQ